MRIQSRQPQQLLKWVGNKQKFAKTIVEVMPDSYNQYIEPFVGTGAVLGYLRPKKGIAGDTLKPLIDLFNLVKNDPQQVARFYQKKIEDYAANPKLTYDSVKRRYNESPNGLDLLFLSRTCYGGVVRFTKEGKISTPIGPHKPISSYSFSRRLGEWNKAIANTDFYHQSFEKTMVWAESGDIVYCDPPYLCSQSILYGAQSFDVNKLWDAIEGCKERGAKVLLSIDGMKKSGKFKYALKCPPDLFERELFINCGKSMLRRFQKKGEVLIEEDVHDRLLLTW